jgi:uncharacterized delta-60 repeat protein
VRPGGKLLAYGQLSDGTYGLTQFNLVNAALSAIDFAERETVVSEGGAVTVKLRRRGDTSQPATAAIRLVSGDAGAIPSAIRFEALQNEATIDITTTDNPLPEWDRGIELALGEVTGAAPGENATAAVRVLDNDGRTGSPLMDTNRWHIDGSSLRDWNTFQGVPMRALTLGHGGRVYLAARGYITAGLFAFDAEGKADPTFGPLEVGSVYGIATQSDGKVLVAGEIRSLLGGAANSIGRVTATGQYDSTFRGFPGSAHGVYDLAVQPDDKILIGGLLRDSAGNGLVRLLKDGLYDPDFSLAPHRFEYVTRVALQTDGKILFMFVRNSLNPEFVMARVNSNGSLDSSFQPYRGPIPYSYGLHALTALPNGKVMLSLAPELRRLNADGTADADFKLGEQPNGNVADVVNLPGGKTLVVGTFKRIGGFARGGMAILNADGSVDTSFDPGVGAGVSHAIVLPNGNFLVGGNFSSFNLQPVKTMAEITTAMTPRFVFWKNANGIQTSFVGNPASKVTIDQSADLKTWQLHETRTLEGFSTPVTAPGVGETKFLRARIE